MKTIYKILFKFFIKIFLSIFVFIKIKKIVMEKMGKIGEDGLYSEVEQKDDFQNYVFIKDMIKIGRTTKEIASYLKESVSYVENIIEKYDPVLEN